MPCPGLPPPWYPRRGLEAVTPIALATAYSSPPEAEAPQRCFRLVANRVGSRCIAAYVRATMPAAQDGRHFGGSKPTRHDRRTVPSAALTMRRSKQAGPNPSDEKTSMPWRTEGSRCTMRPRPWAGK